MIKLEISESKILHLHHLVLDFNGTLAIDGKLIEGVANLLNELSRNMQVHVVTADTFGKAKEALTAINCSLKILSGDSQTEQKLQYIEALGKENVVSIGNGRNDALMLKESALGIALIQSEGIFTGTLLNANIICTHINDALNLLLNPLRVKATLRT